MILHGRENRNVLGEIPQHSFQWKTTQKGFFSVTTLTFYVWVCVGVAVYSSAPDGVSLRDPSVPHLSTTACVYVRVFLIWECVWSLS